MTTMNNVTHFVQKYRQAPWRVQRQWLGLFLLGVVTMAMVAAVYLNVTTGAALAGREIQFLEEEIDTHKRENADYETRLADLTSVENMRTRALALGFEPIADQEILYITVEGYTAQPVADFSVKNDIEQRTVILPEYRQSLFEWFAELLQASADNTGAQQ